MSYKMSKARVEILSPNIIWGKSDNMKASPGGGGILLCDEISGGSDPGESYSTTTVHAAY